MTVISALPFDAVFEARPRDFAGRFPRHARGVGAVRRKRPLGRRALMLLAAVAVPALAAPQEWGAFQIGNAGQAELVLQPMPFEKAGDSFPGSAFYYLAKDDQEKYWAVGTTAPIVADPAEGKPLPGDLGAGAIARAFKIDNSGVDRSRALQCLTAAIYYEARSEPDAGQRAVAQVVLNRVAHPSYPNTVCGVVYQGSERNTGCQFSFTCDGSLARKPQMMFWLRAEDVARSALAGFVYSPVGLATHYHTIAIHPYWAPSLVHVGTIGAHRFYKFGGKAGQASTFRFAYAGGEPMAAPHLRSAAAAASGEDKALDPLALQRAYEAGLQTAQAGGGAVQPTALGITPARKAPAPVYSQDIRQRGGETLFSGEKLPGTTGVREEYKNSGRWIGKPGG